MLRGLSHAAVGWAIYLPFCGALLALAAVEAWRPLHTADEPPGRVGGNIALGLINAAIALLLPVSTVLSAQWAARHQIGLMNLVALPTFVIVIATLLIRNLATYAIHRLSHAVPWLWRVHRVHHADTRLDLSTGFRNHPLELAFVVPWLATVTVGFGLDAPTLLVYESAAIVFALWTHANIRLPDPIDAALRWLLVTPAMHHVHHSSARRETDSNYGDVLSLWDRMFGTYVFLPRDALISTRFGLGDGFDAGAASLVRQLSSPFDRPSSPPVLPSKA